MKKNFVFIALIFSALVLIVVSCKKKEAEPEPTPTPVVNIVSPDPEPGGYLPDEVLPDSLQAVVSQHSFIIHSGENPMLVDRKQFVSSPHTLIYSTLDTDTIPVFYDRYIAFFKNHEYLDFLGKQWDDSLKYYDENHVLQTGGYYEEAYRKLRVVGNDDNFTCYYVVDGYPHGWYLKMSTIFSGRWDESYGGLKDFQVAVVMLENSGDTAVAPAGSIRILGDGDGLAVDTIWNPNLRSMDAAKVQPEQDPFYMFRKR